MKMKRILSTTAIMTAIVTGAIVTSQTVQAEVTRVSEKQSTTEKSPVVKSAHLEHYNVLRLELEHPYVSNNSYLCLMYGENNIIGNAVEKSGKVIAFDINTDDFAKKFPKEQDKKTVVDSLHFMDFSFISERPSKKIQVNNEFVSSTLMNAINEGDLLAIGRVETITNITKLAGYNQFITKDAYADKTLNKKATTKTEALGFKFNVAYKDEYVFSLKDNSGIVSGKVQYHDNDLFVKPTTNTFSNKEYTITATSKVTKTTIDIAKFTPFNLF